MRIYHACRDNHNAGDYIGPYLYKKITGKEAVWSDNFKAKHFMICGSILQEARDKTIVLGAGFGAPDQKIKTKPKLLIVRGHLTEKILLNSDYTKRWELGDPGLFLPFVYNPDVKKRHEIGIVPHYADFDLVDSNKNHVIDICQPVESVIRAILACRRILSSSLHGLVIAHAYGIPALWVEFSDNVVGGGFKFLDYFSTVNIHPYKPLDCRSEIPDELEIPQDKVNINNFKKAFAVLTVAVK